MKPVVILVILLVATAAGCSTKKYLPKIFNPDMAKVNVTQTSLYYEKTGRGIPVIFIHGFSPDTRMWNPQFEHFCRKFFVINYDLRGFGQSPLPTESVSFTHHQDLHACLMNGELEK